MPLEGLPSEADHRAVDVLILSDGTLSCPPYRPSVVFKFDSPWSLQNSS
jgi:hypothetical protein